jgi:hypothetical protein
MEKPLSLVLTSTPARALPISLAPAASHKPHFPLPHRVQWEPLLRVQYLLHGLGLAKHRGGPCRYEKLLLSSQNCLGFRFGGKRKHLPPYSEPVGK